MQCIIMENTLIKLTIHDETKKRAHDSQIVRAIKPIYFAKLFKRFCCYQKFRKNVTKANVLISNQTTKLILEPKTMFNIPYHSRL